MPLAAANSPINTPHLHARLTLQFASPLTLTPRQSRKSIAMQPSRFIRIVRLSACYDMLATWPFATPWTFALMYAQLAALAKALGLPGETPPLDVMHTLLANLLGSVVIVWALARLLHPSVALGRLDAVARLLFATWQIHAVIAGASAVILAFSAFELLFGALQWLPVDGRLAADSETHTPPGKINIASPYEKKR